MSYERAFKARKLPRATYIFGDLDRLGTWELELAGRLYNVLLGAGLRVLNNPARVRQRYSMLLRLKATGYNRFGVWRVEDDERPSRFPVFLRCMSAHRGQLTELLHDPQQVEQAIQSALDRGIPRKELMLTEYCAEPVAEGVFRKLAIFRVGGHMVSTTGVHESHWEAKNGEQGIAGQALYDDEFELIRTNRHAGQLRPVFEQAGIEYGRADFGLVSGQPQTYEINTNPTVVRIDKHPFPIRVEASRLFYEQFCDALSNMDTVSQGRPVPVDDEILVRQRRRDLFMTRCRWVT